MSVSPRSVLRRRPRLEPQGASTSKREGRKRATYRVRFYEDLEIWDDRRYNQRSTPTPLPPGFKSPGYDFFNLPQDVIYLIATHLPSNADKLNFALTCREVYRAVMQSIDLSAKSNLLVILAAEDDNIKLLRHLLHNPQVDPSARRNLALRCALRNKSPRALTLLRQHWKVRETVSPEVREQVETIVPWNVPEEREEDGGGTGGGKDVQGTLNHTMLSCKVKPCCHVV